MLEFAKICRNNDKRSPSIYGIRKKLANKRLVQALEKRYVSNNPQIDDDAAVRNEFRIIYERFCMSADEMLNGRVGVGYKTVRDKLLAHNEHRDGNFHEISADAPSACLGCDRNHVIRLAVAHELRHTL